MYQLTKTLKKYSKSIILQNKTVICPFQGDNFIFIHTPNLDLDKTYLLSTKYFNEVLENFENFEISDVSGELYISNNYNHFGLENKIIAEISLPDKNQNLPDFELPTNYLLTFEKQTKLITKFKGNNATNIYIDGKNNRMIRFNTNVYWSSLYQNHKNFDKNLILPVNVLKLFNNKQVFDFKLINVYINDKILFQSQNKKLSILLNKADYNIFDNINHLTVSKRFKSSFLLEKRHIKEYKHLKNLYIISYKKRLHFIKPSLSGLVYLGRSRTNATEDFFMNIDNENLQSFLATQQSSVIYYELEDSYIKTIQLTQFNSMKIYGCGKVTKEKQEILKTICDKNY